MRGWSEVLSAAGVRDRVLARLTPEVTALLQDPPSGMAWVDNAYFECVAEAVRLELGEERLDTLFVAASKSGWSALLSNWLGAAIRIFGPSPHRLFDQVPTAAKANTVGVTLEWIHLSPESGELALTHLYRPRIHAGVAWGVGAAAQIVGDAMGRPLKRQRPKIEPTASDGTRIRVGVEWSDR